MERTKLSILIDIIFCCLCIMLVVYAWIIKYTKNILISSCASISVGIIVAVILYSINKKHIKTKLKNNHEVIQAKNCFDYLSLNRKKSIQFFERFLDAKNLDDNFFKSEKKFYYINYQIEQFTTAELENILSKNYDNICVLTNNITPLAQELAKNTNIEFISKENVFLLMKEKNLFPIEEQKLAKCKQNKLKNITIAAIDRKKAKHYLLYGVLLLSISMLVPFTFLYCIFGSIFILFGTICLFAKTQKTISK